MSIDPAVYKFFEELPPEQRNDALNALAAEFYIRAPWSNMIPQVSDTMQANGGTGVAFYYQDPETKNIYVPMVVPVKLRDRSDNPQGAAEKYQIPGGHIDFSEGETLIEACMRENAEEAAGSHGPILDDIDEKQLVALDNMLIYLPNGQPMFVNGFGLELTKEQFEKMKLYSDEKIDITPYTKDNEIRAIRVLTLDEILSNPDNLNHPDQASLFQKLKRHITKVEAANKLIIRMA